MLDRQSINRLLFVVPTIAAQSQRDYGRLIEPSLPLTGQMAGDHTAAFLRGTSVRI